MYLQAFVVHTRYKWTTISLNQRRIQNDVAVFAVKDHGPSTYHDILNEALRTDSRILDVNSLSVCPTVTVTRVCMWVRLRPLTVSVPRSPPRYLGHR